MRTCNAAYELGLPHLVADVRIYRDKRQLAQFCHFMLFPGHSATSRLPSLRALEICRPAYDDGSSSRWIGTSPFVLLTRVLRRALFLETLCVPRLEESLRFDLFPLDNATPWPNLIHINAGGLGPLSTRVISLSNLRTAALAYYQEDILHMLKRSQKTLEHLCLSPEHASTAYTMRPLIPRELNWPNLRVLQVKGMQTEHLPHAMPNIRKLFIHDGTVLGEIGERGLQGRWSSLEYLFATGEGVVNNSTRHFPCQCRTLEVDLSNAPLIFDEWLQLISVFVHKAHPVHLALELRSGLAGNSHLLSRLRLGEIVADLGYLKLLFVVQENTYLYFEARCGSYFLFKSSLADSNSSIRILCKSYSHLLGRAPLYARIPPFGCSRILRNLSISPRKWLCWLVYLPVRRRQYLGLTCLLST